MTRLLPLNPATAAIGSPAAPYPWLPGGAAWPRVRSAVLTAGRFVLHFAEMCVAMQVGMLIFMLTASAIPGALQGLGMALFMATPMVIWKRVRGHRWRHGFE